MDDIQRLLNSDRYYLNQIFHIQIELTHALRPQKQPASIPGE